MQKFNEFSIQNGLGDIDGFVTLENAKSDINYLQSKNNQQANNNEVSELLEKTNRALRKRNH